MRRMQTKNERFCRVAACLLAFGCGAVLWGEQIPEKRAQAIFETAGVRGGLVVHLGCGDGRLTAALHRDKSYVVQGLEVFESLGPVALEQSGERSVGEQAPLVLALRAVVALPIRVADALHRRAAVGAGLLVLAVDGHFRAEGGDLLREPVPHLSGQVVGPPAQGLQCI